MIRQGDVALVRIKMLPTVTTQPRTDRIVLAEGEATGHAHTVDGTKAALLLDEGGWMYLTVEELTEVQHQEHAPLTLEPGFYRVLRQREATDDEEGWARVTD